MKKAEDYLHKYVSMEDDIIELYSESGDDVVYAIREAQREAIIASFEVFPLTEENNKLKNTLLEKLDD